MPEDASVSSLLRVHRGSAEPEELAAIAVVVACLAGRLSRAASPPKEARHHRRHPRPEGHGCWAGCWACR
ncbi:acyl-CoA carboxylase subunit epsilon [Streptomyces sp. NPDC093093]|uniref:acyl-CoA carboxylase subunit epsilon n=1 Tax=Streptomyces sp. NPDC093093 TaxID=3366025 RepID=UPI003817E35E